MTNSLTPEAETKLWDCWMNGRGLEETIISMRRHGFTVGREQVRRYFVKFCDQLAA